MNPLGMESFFQLLAPRGHNFSFPEYLGHFLIPGYSEKKIRFATKKMAVLTNGHHPASSLIFGAPVIVYSKFWKAREMKGSMTHDRCTHASSIRVDLGFCRVRLWGVCAAGLDSIPQQTLHYDNHRRLIKHLAVPPKLPAAKLVRSITAIKTL